MLAQEAVERAYREAAIKTINSPAFTPAELDEGLSRLNGFLMSLFGAEIGENLSEWAVPTVQITAPLNADPVALPFPSNQSDYDQTFPIGERTPASTAYVSQPPQNSRVLWRGGSAGTVYLPSNPSDGARMAFVSVASPANLTIDGNGRLVDGASTMVLLPGFDPLTLFYRSDLADWRPIQPLTLTDPLPLPPEFDDLLVAGTAIRLTGLDEIDPTAGTMFIYNRLLPRCKQRYTQRASTSYGGQNVPDTHQSYNQWYGGNPW
jgi:hypothetical protein